MADNEIKNMISDLTKRLGSLKNDRNKAALGYSSQSDDDDHGTKIITLAGTNVGASMRGDMEEKLGIEGDSTEENEVLKTDNIEHHETPPREHGKKKGNKHYSET
ncbi:uncharacterized protein LOC129895526 [Solanum dulcamara]|uniref:uncharacterized protein LOC129895526 n=1 Tax=Solanum dulcamara TaxID=45834 RepID=UPI002485B034|nr:uncharacterized protein LOC129895526 [Solanum dulcamara]